MIIATARDAADFLEPLLAGAPGARWIVLHLDGERRVIAVERHDVAADQGGLPVREIVADCLRHASIGLVVARSRADGDAGPGPAEIEATRRLADAAAGLGMRLHDHLVFAGGRWTSFRELGLL